MTHSLSLIDRLRQDPDNALQLEAAAELERLVREREVRTQVALSMINEAQEEGALMGISDLLHTLENLPEDDWPALPKMGAYYWDPEHGEVPVGFTGDQMREYVQTVVAHHDER